MLNIFDHTCWGFSTCTITCTHCEQKKVTNKRKILGCMAFSKLSWYSVLFPFPPPLSSFPVHNIDDTSHIPVGLHGMFQIFLAQYRKQLLTQKLFKVHRAMRKNYPYFINDHAQRMVFTFLIDQHNSNFKDFPSASADGQLLNEQI